MTHGKDWMVGASTCSVSKATPEVVRAYAEAGLDAMEISLKAHEYAALDLPALRRAADDTGLTLWSLHLPFSKRSVHRAQGCAGAQKCDGNQHRAAAQTGRKRYFPRRGASRHGTHGGRRPRRAVEGIEGKPLPADRGSDQRRRAAVRGGAAAHLPRQLFRGDGLPLGRRTRACACASTSTTCSRKAMSTS